MGTTTNFNYTGAVQDFVVPADIDKLKVMLHGGKSGSNQNPGSVQGILDVTPSETLKVHVGGQGTTPAGGWNGGGSGGTSTGGTLGLGGGGATDIRQGGTALANRVAVAAGAGGTGGVGQSGSAGIGGRGGSSIGESGGNATGLPTSGGGGGTQSAGGTGGAGGASLGEGGTGTNGSTGETGGGGGGGGGYYGGAGGSTGTNTSAGGGGGGSNYVGGLATVISNIRGLSSSSLALIQYNRTPTVDVTGPTGTITVARPTITWSYSDADGDAQASYRVKIFRANQYLAPGFDPNTTLANWDSNKIFSSANSVQVGLDLVNGTTYRAYVQVTDLDMGLDNHTSAWDYEEFTVNNAKPVADVTAPIGTINNTSAPEATWAYTDTEGDPQIQYVVSVRESPSNNQVYYSGWLYGANTSHQLPSLGNGDYTLEITVKQAFGTGGLNSDIESQAFTIDVVPPPEPTVTDAYFSDDGRVEVTASNTGGSPTTDEFDFQMQLPNGTWVDLGVDVAADGNQEATVTTYEFIPNSNTLYRARARSYDPGTNEPYSSAWVEHQTLIQIEDWWLKDLDDPSHNMQVSIVGTTLEQEKPRDQGVFNPLGRKNQVVVSDIQKSGSFDRVTIETLSVEERDALEAMLDESVGHDMLLQSPSSFGEQWYVHIAGDPKRTNQNMVEPWDYYDIKFVITGRS